jgi:hypothetical protein
MIAIKRYIRTPYSESYLFFEGNARIAHLDLHILDYVQATLIIERNLVDDEIDELIERAEEEIISGIEPRNDFILDGGRN